MQRVGQRPNHYFSSKCSTFLKRDGMVELSVVSQNQTEKVICVGLEEPTDHYVIHVQDDTLFVRSNDYTVTANRVTGVSQDNEVTFKIEFDENGLLSKLVLEKGHPAMVIVYE